MQSSKQELVKNLVQRSKMKFEARAYDDIMQTLNSYNSLKPIFKHHVFPDGISRWCLSLSGTLPINYKGFVYHIPIILFLMDNHPYSGPYCYVCPTNTMRIRVSEVIDEKGRIYLPYLTEWRYPGYNTCGLLQVMTISFEEKTPVYSISNSSNTVLPQQPNLNQPNQSSVNLPYPTNPSLIMPQPSSYSNLQNIYPITPNNYQPSYPLHPHYPSVPSINSLTNNELRISNVNFPLNDKNNVYSNNTVQPNHIRASLISAIQDKIKNILKEKIGDPFAELQSIDINLQELRTGQQKLRDILEKIEKDQAELDVIVLNYKEKKLELKKALELYNVKEETSDEKKIDNAIDATTPLHRQIFRCYVQDVAIDDTIYFLGQALKKGIINLQTYLKYVRQLSRKQFVYRATLQKCRKTANLPV